MIPAGLSDEDLVAAYVDPTRSRADRETAFHELVTRYQHRVFAICVRQLDSRTDAEDATQETFCNLARRAEQFRGASRWSTFVYRVAVNACRDLQRKQARRPQTPTADVDRARTSAGRTPDVAVDEIAARDEAMVVREALGRLDDVSRLLLVLCAVQGLSYAEASEILDMPVGTIKSRVFRARARLAELLADGDEPVPPGARDDEVAPGEAWPHSPPRGPPA